MKFQTPFRKSDYLDIRTRQRHHEKRKQGPIFLMNTNETILNKILFKMNAEYIKNILLHDKCSI